MEDSLILQMNQMNTLTNKGNLFLKTCKRFPTKEKARGGNSDLILKEKGH